MFSPHTGMPKCEGEGELEEQMETTLSCLVETQGSLDGSAVDWYANDVKVDVEDVKDDSSIGKLFKVLDLVATPSMDQVTYTCRTNVGSFVQECSIFLDVKCKYRPRPCNGNVKQKCIVLTLSVRVRSQNLTSLDLRFAV